MVASRFLIQHRCWLMIVIWATLAWPISAGEWFASPNGKSDGLGTLAEPWDLGSALADNSRAESPNHKIAPGDTLWLLPGNYNGSFSCRLLGAETKPIVVRNYQQQRATIDHATGEGLSVVAGGYVWFWGLEFAATNSARYSKQTSSFPQDISTGVHLSFNNARGMKVINSIFHDGSGAVGASITAEDVECTGNLMYYAGWSAPDRTHGHGTYAQNKTGTKRFRDNILFHNASHGMHAYGSQAAFISDFHLEGNVFFNNGELFDDTLRGRNFLLGGGSVTRQCTVAENMLYRHKPTVNHSSSDFMLGFGTGMSESTIRDNYVVGETMLAGPFTNVEIKNNTFIGGMWSDPKRDPHRDVPQLYPHNAYMKERPAEAKVFVRGNPYEPGRGHVVIYNWLLAKELEIDPAPLGLVPGDGYTLHNVLDFYGDQIQATYQGGNLSVSMVGRSVSKPAGIPAPQSSFPEFGVFVLMKQPR
jgi:hypothetical protein